MRAMQEQHKIAEFFTADKEKSHKQSGRNDCGERLAEKKPSPRRACIRS